MKTLIPTLIVAALLVLVCGCGGGDGSDSSDGDSVVSATPVATPTPIQPANTTCTHDGHVFVCLAENSCNLDASSEIMAQEETPDGTAVSRVLMRKSGTTINVTECVPGAVTYNSSEANSEVTEATPEETQTE